MTLGSFSGLGEAVIRRDTAGRRLRLGHAHMR